MNHEEDYVSYQSEYDCMPICEVLQELNELILDPIVPPDAKQELRKAVNLTRVRMLYLESCFNKPAYIIDPDIIINTNED